MKVPSEDVPPETLGDRIRRLREYRGLSQKGLASAAEVHRNTLLAIEKNRSSPDADTVGKIAGALGVAPDVLEHSHHTYEAGKRDAILEVREHLEEMWESLATVSDEEVADDLDEAFREQRRRSIRSEANGGAGGRGT